MVPVAEAEDQRRVRKDAEIAELLNIRVKAAPFVEQIRLRPRPD